MLRTVTPVDHWISGSFSDGAMKETVESKAGYVGCLAEGNSERSSFGELIRDEVLWFHFWGFGGFGYVCFGACLFWVFLLFCLLRLAWLVRCQFLV